MMNMLEEATIYATIMHQGKIRKLNGIPVILHVMEVAQILSTMTDDQELITAGILHDIVAETDGTLEEIGKRFGKRVEYLVSSISGQETMDGESGGDWKRRREDFLLVLKNSGDVSVQMLWLAEKLASIRSLSGAYSETGEAIWAELQPSDSAMQRWYYRSVAEHVELSLNKTGAFKELIKHINFIWPGTFDSDKAKYKKYREVSVAGCKLLGRGAKGDVYRYDDELIIKVYNRNNTYRDVEREIALSRKAFILGIPTAISFGIVSVGDRYGAMYELVNSETVSRYIAKTPDRVETYAKIMAELARTIHSVTVPEDDVFPPNMDRLRDYIDAGIACEDEALAERCRQLLEALPASHTLIHGDFHTGNVFLQNGEALLIDMDRVSWGHPIAELSDLYYAYVVRGEEKPSVVEDYMGFSYRTAQEFFRFFLMYYLDTEDETRLREVTDKAAFLCYTRMIRNIRKKGALSEKDLKSIKRCVAKTAELLERVDSLDF